MFLLFLGTIAIYEDMDCEEAARLEQEALDVMGGAAPQTAKVSTDASSFYIQSLYDTMQSLYTKLI